MINKIEIKHTYIELSPYRLGHNPSLEAMLSIYDNITCKYVAPFAYYYDEDKKSLRITRGVNVKKLESIFDIVATMSKIHDPYDKIRSTLKIDPRDDDQKTTISFILGKNNYSYTSTYSRLFIKNDTGTGKSYCAIASAIHRGMKTCIFAPTKHIMGQWVRYLHEYTDLLDSDIYLISGSNTIDMLFKDTKLVKRNKFYIISYDTITSYAKSNGWSVITELFKLIKVGFKIFDEAHQQFDAMLKIDLNTNTKYTLYLTASAERSKLEENKLYSLVFSNVPSIMKKSETPHINVTVIFFNSGGNIADEASMVQPRRGLSQIKYMKYMTEGKGFGSFTNVIDKILAGTKGKINRHNSKMMILLGTINACDIIYQYISEKYTEYDVGIYNSSIKDKEFKKQQLEKDIILSISKSLGVGSDIFGLKWLFMAESYSSAVTGKQIKGRLRDNGDEYHYIEAVDTSIGPVRKQFSTRKKYLLDGAKTYREVMLKYVDGHSVLNKVNPVPSNNLYYDKNSGKLIIKSIEDMYNKH